MKLKVIGSGSKGNAYALVGEEETLLIECGMPLKEVKKAIDYNILKIKGCLLSHEHGDHLKYIKEYLKAGITVYTNEFTKEKIDQNIGLVNVAQELKRFQIGGFLIVPFYVPHNEIPCFSYLIEHKEMGRLLFATDFEYLPWTFKEHRIQHFLIEANYHMPFVNKDIPNYEHILKGHCSLETCIGIVRMNKTPELRNVIMCHLGSSGDVCKYFKTAMKRITGNAIQVACATSGTSFDLMKEPF